VWLRFLYRTLAGLPHRLRGTRSVNGWKDPASAADATRDSPNPLRDYYERQAEGPGMQKWRHYFDVYQRHLGKFVGRAPVIVEIGVDSGGSLAMWRHYFGAGSRVHGIDIDPGCVAFRGPDIDVHIGDQADRAMWKRFREAVPQVDIVIDDGGHTALQQRITLEEMLPHLRPGGVYVCEDVHGIGNRFAEYVAALGHGLNAYPFPSDPSVEATQRTPFQAAIHSVHLYPFLVVIEKQASAPEPFLAPTHGTQWRPTP
jgi:23S rRNA U2552 (ribose-2'-O)-methylase RlmE/FtsJ